MTGKPTAEIIGAGIGGLTAATALAQRGWQIRLHERESEIRAIGAGIYVWGNGLATLRALGLHDEAVIGAHIGPTLESRDRRGRTVERLTINGPDQPQVKTIMRDRLIRTLVAGAVRAGVEIRTGSEIVAADPAGAVFDSAGTRFGADLVVAADGVNSRIRDTLGVPMRRIRSTQGAIRLTVPWTQEFVAPEDRGSYLEFFSGRRRVLYTPSSAEHLYVALVADTSDTAATTVPIDVDSWVRSFPALETLIRSLAEVPGRWDTFEFIRLRRWSTGRVAFLGDAAHAQPPYLGQGGGCAMMNALGLADAVSAAPQAITKALGVWEATERPTIEHTQRWSYGLRLLNNLPDAARSPLLRTVDRMPILGRSRLRAAVTIPTGCDAFAAAERTSE
ncbi:putative monooxygenase [Nocardia nova SH22a]|uniref:Putative monooxygenase n=1 Tax=Nocardia nova SH22a TaxID=1415166 RepID=W5TPA8_9NOCA|nr:NAD(P)/FAD-dependent oxidoreductase [Nocardia nova]AHH20969.1 putative monooxygenase [Nocardia nova SH22a]